MTRNDFKRMTAALLAAALACPQAAFAAEAAKSVAAPAVFQGVEVSDDFVAIKLSTAVQYNSFVTQTPPRLVVDLLDTQDGAPGAAAKGSGRLLSRVRSGQFQRRPRLITRVVLDLTKTAGYRVGSLSNGLGIRLIDGGEKSESGGLDESAAAAAAVPAAPAPVPAPAPTPAKAPTAAVVPSVFQGVEVSDNFVSLKLSGAVQYKSFVTQTPPRRLVVDLLDTRDGAPGASAKGSGRLFSSVRSGQRQWRPRLITRVVLDLAKTAGYRIGSLSSGLGIRLIDGSGKSAAGDGFGESAAPAAPVVPVPSPAAAPALAVAAAPVVAAQKVEPVRPVVAAASVPVAAPVAPAVEAKAVPRKAKAVEDESMDKASADAQDTDSTDQILVPATGSRFAVEKPVPPTSEKLSAAAAFKRAGLQGEMHTEVAAVAEYDDANKSRVTLPASVHPGHVDSGRIGGSIYQDLISRLPRDPVTLDFDGTDIRDVIKLLAAKSRINIIYGPDVTGTLTLHLSDVPFSEAFRTILSMMQLTTSQTGSNVLRVITPAELTKQRTAGTTITKVIQLNYAKPEDVKKTVDAVRTAEGRLGNTSVDDKTNSVIVTETLEGMTATENLVGQLDQRPQQVLIEAKIVEVNASMMFDYGVQWSQYGAQNGSVGGQPGLSTYGSPVGYFSTTSNQPATLMAPGASGGMFPIGATGQGTGVQLPADNIFGALTLGRITSSYIINATITAAASEGKAKILSDPKIATLNNQAATIAVTSQIPYVTSNVSPTAATVTETVNYVTTGITLTVTPTINADGRILLIIQPNVSQPSATAAANTQTGAPAIDTRNANTTVLVRDGETVVIGGLISDSVSDTISKIPFLGDIPVLGWLFKKKSQSRTRMELLIFVTTRIMPD
ncbi:MAG: type IV pilus secretin PilQ [Elusimicrobia bacterium]|nr:type IV pilus secretin PilQ [Elusimicrobiota bacterium]